MPTRLVRGAFRLALVAVAGAAASLVLAAPASADGPPVKAINDGQANCTVTGDILVPWHIVAQFPVAINNVQSNPDGVLFIDGDPPWDFNVLIWQLVPGGTTTSGLTLTWTEVANPQNTGTGTGTTTQPYPTCSSEVSAEFASKCDRLVDVTLHNDSDAPVTFSVNGATHAVAGGATTVVKNVAAQANGDVDVAVDTFLKGIPADTYTWSDPGGCATPSPTSSANPSLPLTGSSVGGVIGIGGGLLAAGALLVALSIVRRRRRVTSGS